MGGDRSSSTGPPHSFRRLCSSAPSPAAVPFQPPNTGKTSECGDFGSGFLKRALAQTCFRVWYQVRFLRRIFGHSWGLVYGEGGGPWYGTSAQPESHFTCSSPRGAPWVVPSTSLLNYFWAFLVALGRGEGAPLVRYLCKTQKSLHGRHV